MNEQVWQQLYIHIHKAAETMQDDWDDGERHVPSPSTVAACRLQQWFKGVKWPRTNRIPVDSLKKMNTGTLVEPFWRGVYSRAGFNVVSPTRPLEVGAMRSRGGDGILYVEDKDLAALLAPVGIRMGSSLLLELKDLGAWTYCDFVQLGVEKGLPEYWAQVQAYLHGFDIDYCIFHGGMADASGTKFIWRRIRKLGDEVPPFWMEVIKKEPIVVNEVLGRAEEVDWAIKNNPIEAGIPIVLRDFNSPDLVEKNKFPCAYCGWADACVGKVQPAKVLHLGDYRKDSE